MMNANRDLIVKPWFDAQTRTVSYVIHAPHQAHCAVIDPVLGFDVRDGSFDTSLADEILVYIESQKLSLTWILETHVHADHVTAASYLKEKAGGKIAIGCHVTQVQAHFKPVFNLPESVAIDGSQFDVLFDEDQVFYLGDVPIQALYVPGHTFADVAYVVGDHVFVGDTLFAEDLGTARCDFPGGSARLLYNSVQKLYALPDHTKIWFCHDYPENLSRLREVRYHTTIGTQKQANVHLHVRQSMDAFVVMRTERDMRLSVPALLYPSIQLNILAGKLPDVEASGLAYLKVPLKPY